MANECSICNKEIKTVFVFKDGEGNDKEIPFSYRTMSAPRHRFCSTKCSDVAKKMSDNMGPGEFFLAMQHPSM